MDIRELRSFIHVARAGSFSRAAAELYIAQPALSRQVAKLEEEIGVELLARHGRGVRLTAAGARLLERAEMISNMVSETGEHVRATADEERGYLAVGLPPTMGALIGAELVRDFREVYPRVALHIREGQSSSLQEWVADRRVDLAVVYNQPPLDAFKVRPLYSEPMILIAPPGTPIPKDGFQIRDLASLPLILPGMPHSNRRVIEHAAVQNGIRLRLELEVDSVALTKKLVRAGVGYSILTSIAIRDELASGDLVAEVITRPSIRSTVAITTLRENPLSRFATDWMAMLREKLKRFVGTEQWNEDIVWLDNEATNSN
ncbi:LysR family transcriptional regulator [Caballeronia arvi]|uniref:LysR family transcriptional regulator n=1 Tax=Caballeronia arvi TaxID=1777135 RepID=A0A158KZK5_9BURK|nr:LysR substrate-binding domain-containing protein [Caballeronia arvi]SAL86153.1 LysR family transcriptional regulator [Caballeronia arvi]